MADDAGATPVEVAGRLVRERFPEAVAAFVGGSVLTGDRTPTSDLDIVVLRPEGLPVFRETVRYAGWPVELFVHTLASYGEFLAREVAAHRSPLLHMVGLGTVLVDADGTAARLHAEARRRWAAGPPPAGAERVEDLRYAVSDLLDDLTGARDRDEVLFVAARLSTEAGLLALTVAGEWLGGGKWLGRQLRRTDPQLHAALAVALRAAATGDRDPLAAVAGQVLRRAGGRLLEGYHRAAPPP